MTKRRPSNKKPTGVNRSLGNSLLNERERNRRSHQKSKFEGEVENAAMLDKVSKKVIDSITEESGLEEFLAKAQLAGTEFSADRENVRIVSENKSVVIPSRKDFLNNVELQAQYKDKLKIPRRPSRDRWNSIEELNLLENEVFLKWREDLAELQDVDGLSLTPFERNPEMWKELWRVVEKSDIVVQIVDARNPLLFRSQDLEDYVKEVDPAKQNLLLVNKADLLPSELVHVWAAYFREQNINAVFWSAMDELEKIDEDDEEMEKEQEQEPSCSSEASDVCYLRKKEDLIAMLKRMGHVTGTPGEKPLMIGMVGYPNVGKSSTINKLVGAKKVSVSATPGKTRHFQTIWVDKELCLCDCPGLVMPSFSFGRNEMFLNGIMPVDQMRDHYGPTSLLLSRVALDYLENRYSLLLPDREKPSATDLLTTLAFNRGFMSAAGIPDSSRAARLLIKDVVTGKILWVASPPNQEQEDINELMYASSVSGETKRAGAVQLQELEKRGLLLDEKTRNKEVDVGFFAGDTSSAHIRTSRGLADVHESSQTGSTASSATTELGSKKHFNKKKKEKLRRVFVGTYA